MKNDDRLERFIIENRSHFDDLIPDDSLFQNIETIKPPAKRSLTLWQVTARIAAAVILFFSGYSIQHFMGNKSAENHLNNNSAHYEVSSDSAYRAFSEMQHYYQNQIDQVSTDIITLVNNDQEVHQEIEMELNDLKKIFEDLKNDLNDQANNKEVIDAMIMNYRVKLKLLEDMREQLKPQTNTEEVRYETLDI